LIFLKWRPTGCALVKEFPQEKDFPQSNLLLRGPRILASCNFRWSTLKIREKHARRKILLRRVAQLDVPCKKKSAKNMLSGKPFSCEKSWTDKIKK
jgi:hypothetical protein